MKSFKMLFLQAIKLEIPAGLLLVKIFLGFVLMDYLMFTRNFKYTVHLIQNKNIGTGTYF